MTKNNALVLLLFLLFLAGGAFGLSFETGKPVYALGEQVKVLGECSGSTVKVRIVSGQKELFEKFFECKGNGFAAEIVTDYSFPDGSWAVVVESNNVSTSRSISVSAPREARLLGVQVFSPALGEKSRASVLDISLQVSLFEKNVDNARVFAWNTSGEKVILVPKGDGIYGAEIEIPFDFKGRELEMVVVADYEKNEKERFGGKTVMGFPVKPADIDIEVVKPKSWILATNVSEEVVVKAMYSSGKTARNAQVKGIVGEKAVGFAPAGEDTFRASLYFSSSEKGSSTLKIIAVDSAGNTGEKTIPVFVEESFLPQFFSPDVSFLLAAIVMLAIIAIVFYARKVKGVEGLVRQKEIVLDRIEKLQKDYYKEKKVSKGFFESESKRLELKLSKIEEELKEK